MTINTVVSRLRNGLKEVSRDSYYTNRQLWNIALTSFLKIINQRKNIHKLDIFTKGDFEVEEVNLLENSCVPLNCIGYRVCLDDVLETKQGLVFKYIGSPDLSELFKLVSPKTYQLKLDKTKGNTNYAFFDSGYLYFNKYFPCLKISYLSKDGECVSCSKLDNKLNIPDFILDDVIKMSLQELAPLLQKQPDRVGDKS